MNTNIRPTLWALLLALVVILWFKWEAENAPKTIASKDVQQPIANSNVGNNGDIDLPLPTPAATANSKQTIPGASPQALHSGKLIQVKTDVLSLTIDTQGGAIVESQLLQYSQSVSDNTPIKLFNSAPGKLFHFQTGLNSDKANNATHEASFTAPQANFELADGDSISVPLTWQADGVTVSKVFTFYRGRYDFAVKQTVNNNSNSAWNGYQYRQLRRNEVSISRGLTTFNTFAGAVYSTPDNKYNKLSFADMRDSDLAIKNVTGGWVGMMEHYFMGAIIPPQDKKDSFYSHYLKDGSFSIGLYGSSQSIPVGGSAEFNTVGFVGPKIKNDLARIAPNLDKATDYGWFFFISEFLFNVLNWMHSVVKNWGWAIVIVTLLIKAMLFPLAAKSFKSMAKMRKFQPEMERIRENYSEDRQLQGKKMMELYKKEGINPASGCLPILIQIPIFLAFYYMLMESVELRQAPWIFWIKDLSIKDPYYVLPVINMGLMFVQQRLNPPPSDPIQRRVMMFLPLIFGFLFLFFPSGLVLYWAVSNSFSIIQQYVITKRYGGLANPLSHAEDKHYHPKK